jgi:prevent-host-death family protein
MNRPNERPSPNSFAIDLTSWSGLVRLKKEATMPITNISEAKAQLSALIERVLAGEEIIIGKAGKPVARLVRFERPVGPRQPGALKGRIRIAGDFDELPEDLQDTFGMNEP